ncbi:MAG: hypothetical protein IPM23_08395 [Candidatus Melainabacteria bacterium]|nr:hypothetical protein [Candidatus Melainabacteria bacterium]
MKPYETYWGLNTVHDGSPACPCRGEALSAVARLRERRACDCEDWLADLADSYQEVADGGSAYRDGILQRKLMVFWVKALFEQLEGFANQFNCRIAQPCLSVEVENPSFHKVSCQEVSVFNPNGVEKLYYEGHIVNGRTALLLRGVDNEVDAFLLPSSSLLRLSFNPDEEAGFVAFIRLYIDAATPDRVTLQISSLDGERIEHIETSSIPLLARYLFSAFIEESMNCEELCSYQAGELARK